MRDRPTRAQTALLTKLRRRRARIAIYGLGYVGLPLALRFAEAGFTVLGFDTDLDKVKKLNAGRSYIERIPHVKIQAARAAGFAATDDYARTADADALIICVPTPLNQRREPNLEFIIATINAIAPHLREGQVVSLESTTYPGTTEEELLPRIAKRGLAVGEQVFLVYSPEREDPGNPHFRTQTIPKVCGGYTPNCLRVGTRLYAAAIDEVVPVSSLKIAEMTKLLENIYRAVNVSLVNEMHKIADCMGIDIFEAIDAAATKPFGYAPFYPGPGTGGHCLPIDPFYLSWRAKQYGVDSEFIRLAGEVSEGVPGWHVARMIDRLRQRGKKIDGAAVLILGVAYKKNTDDLRESPALKIMKLLRARGAKISYSDPHVPRVAKLRDYDFDLRSESLTADLLTRQDAVVLCADHDRFDYELIRKHSALLADTRGVFRKLKPAGA